MHEQGADVFPRGAGGGRADGGRARARVPHRSGPRSSRSPGRSAARVRRCAAGSARPNQGKRAGRRTEERARPKESGVRGPRAEARERGSPESIGVSRTGGTGPPNAPRVAFVDDRLGEPRRQLDRQGHTAARCTVAPPMREMGPFGAVWGCRIKSAVPAAVAERPMDPVESSFTAERPNRPWANDFTYGDGYDNALTESVIGFFETEVIRRRGSWGGPEEVEFADPGAVHPVAGVRGREPVRRRSGDDRSASGCDSTRDRDLPGWREVGRHTEPVRQGVDPAADGWWTGRVLSLSIQWRIRAASPSSSVPASEEYWVRSGGQSAFSDAGRRRVPSTAVWCVRPAPGPIRSSARPASRRRKSLRRQGGLCTPSLAYGERVRSSGVRQRKRVRKA